MHCVTYGSFQAAAAEHPFVEDARGALSNGGVHTGTRFLYPFTRFPETFSGKDGYIESKAQAEQGITLTRTRHAKLPRQTNPIAATPPMANVCPNDGADAVRRKVQKGGAVNLTIFRHGSEVNVVKIDEQTVLVTARSKHQVKQLLQGLPSTTPSPFYKVSALIAGRAHNDVTPRARHTYSSDAAVIAPLADADALASADVARTRRPR